VATLLRTENLKAGLRSYILAL